MGGCKWQRMTGQFPWQTKIVIGICTGSLHWLTNLGWRNPLLSSFWMACVNLIMYYSQLMSFCLDTFFDYFKKIMLQDLPPKTTQDLPRFASQKNHMVTTRIVPIIFGAAEILSWLLENFHASPMEAQDAIKIGGAWLVLFGKIIYGINEVPVLPIYGGYMLDNTILSLGFFNVYRDDSCHNGSFL